MEEIMLIGSRALALRNPQLLNRKPLDFDFIGSRTSIDNWIAKNRDLIGPAKSYETEDGKKWIVEGAIPLEFEYAENNNSAEQILNIVKEDKLTLRTDDFGMVPSLDLLFLLKTSHRFLSKSPHYFKTFKDWYVMKQFGATIREEYKDLLKLREKETYKKKTPKLQGMKANEFFTDNVIYSWHHDDIHEAIKHLEKPAYCYYLRDGSEVDCDKEKFFGGSEKIRLAGAVEEAEVLFLERFYWPNERKVDVNKGIMIAIQKCFSGIVGGWFREYGYEHIPEIIKIMRTDGFIEKFDKGIEIGEIRPYKKEGYPIG